MNHELEKRLLAYMTGIDRIYASKDRDGCCGERHFCILGTRLLMP